MYGWNGKANGRMDGCMDAWNGWMEWEGERMNGRMHGCMEWVDAMESRTDEGTDEWMNGRMNGWMDGMDI